MFDKIAGRALVPVGIVVTGFLVVCFVLLYAAIKQVVIRDSITQANNLAGVVLKSTRYAMMKSDSELNSAIIRNISAQNGVQHVRIFNKKGVVAFSSKPEEVNRQVDKKAEGCVVCHEKAAPVTTLGTMQKARTFKNTAGEEILAITAPIYNEPECANAACHFHPAEQRVLGTLDIGLSQEATLHSLALIRMQMLIFSILTLFLTIAGVITLLKMIVLVPMRKLQEYTERGQEGNGTSRPPNLPYELDKIAQSYYFIRAKLNEIEQKPFQTTEKGPVCQHK
ncbi:cytochrome C [Geomonas sp. Red69]|uniref:cytochrome C n=1 Tax=Geomonas diazotrophica TaxID=2843197 RepID=UPI001C1220AC|nr:MULTISPECIES: cytochrome C [Geomonas]MBU5635646.1 cytochrome C [Geomonas diazotrophica]QXE87243.1 cytochrome C [Geomonas nitrogeniifigens]